jgi:hypothetical protein
VSEFFRPLQAIIERGGIGKASICATNSVHFSRVRGFRHARAAPMSGNLDAAAAPRHAWIGGVKEFMSRTGAAAKAGLSMREHGPGRAG